MEATNYEDLSKDDLIKRVGELENRVEKLLHQLSVANKYVFGRKSEKLSVDPTGRQMSIFPQELPKQEVVPDTVKVPAHTRKKNSGRKPLPNNLPRERIECAPTSTKCACCGKDLIRIGEEITEELDIVPAHMVVREYVRGKYACGSCKEHGVETAPLPPSVQPLERSRPGIGLLVYIIIAKYVDHMPLYRLEKTFLRMGVEIPRQRMSDWLAGVIPKLLLLYQCLLKEMLSVDYLQADETRIKVQDPDVVGKLLEGYFWGIHSPDLKLAAFHYYATRASEAPQSLLKGFHGVLQTDCYAGYNIVLLPDKTYRLACMAHIRRKFIEATKTAPSECNYVVELIAKLYHIEKLAKDKTPAERKEFRLKHAPVILEKLEKYLRGLQESALPKEPVQRAVSYALSQWKEVLRYLEDGRYHIDNNAMEREIRPIAVGRKNYLFAGSHEAAQRAAMLYSFIACCRLNNVNPSKWLTDVFTRLPEASTSDLPNLLPHRWLKLRTNATASAA